jgi:CRISPR-associated protein Cmr4
MTAISVFIHAITPLHAGTGQGVDIIDQPIARERATQLPLLPGSSIKGVLRDRYDEDRLESEAERLALFGRSTEGATDFAGALQFSDARLLLFPVRSLAATFVWTTCPLVLGRFVRDLKSIYGKIPQGVPAVPSVTEDLWLAADKNCALTLDSQPHLVLEDLSAPVQGDEVRAKSWAQWIGTRLFPNGDAAWQRELAARFAILDDASFTHLAENATEAVAHVAIDHNTGTVEKGKLWYQESLPAETVLASVVRAERPRNPASQLKDATETLSKLRHFAAIQFGGKSTTGHGVARFLPLYGMEKSS